MAPGRKRGAKGAKAKTDLRLGDLVLAKVKGFPPWPAKISRPEDSGQTPDLKKYFVKFFGTEEIAFVAPSDIQEFTSEAKNKLQARCQGKSKTVKYFAKAVKEICEEFEELQQEKSSGLCDDTDRPAAGCDLPPVDNLVVDNVEADLKDGIKEGIGEHCSHSHGEIDCKLKPCNASLSPVISPRKRTKAPDDNEILLKEEVSVSSPHCRSSQKVEGLHGCNSEDNAIHAEQLRTVTGTDDCKISCHSNLGQKFSNGLNQEEGSALSLSVYSKQPGSERMELTNGHKSNNVVGGSKRKSEGNETGHSAILALECDSTGGHANSSKLCDHSKVAMQRRITPSGSMKELSPDSLKLTPDINGTRKSKIPQKDKTRIKMVNDLPKDSGEAPKELAKGDVSGRKMKVQHGSEKHAVGTNEGCHLVKRSKYADVVNDASKGLYKTNKSDLQSLDVLDGKEDNTEAKRSVLRVKSDNHLTSTWKDCGAEFNSSGDDEALPPTKRSRRELEAMSVSSSSEDKTNKSYDNVKSPVQLYTKRRAVRLCDDDYDEEPKTPIHGGKFTKVLVHSQDSIKTGDVYIGTSHHDELTKKSSGGLEDESLNEVVTSAKLCRSSSTDSQKATETWLKKAVATRASCSPGKLELEKILAKEAKQGMESSKNFLHSVAANKLTELKKASKGSGKASIISSQRKDHFGSIKLSGAVSDTSHYQATTEKNMPLNLGERQKSTPKSISRTNDSSAVVAENQVDNESLSVESVEAVRDDRLSLMTNSKVEDSVTSMKHLIAAAQAKRRENYSQNLTHGNSLSVLSSTTDIPAGSTSPPLLRTFFSGSNDVMQQDVPGYHPLLSLASPLSHQFSSISQLDTENFEERRVSSGHRAAGGSLSGGTEAAVARDAFEGMIETLSRTKESIGRATRLAIDCAKYGIAYEVVELLIRKLESEPSFHRKVDLFFLVDSITQCSHSHKGIAGASYIPAVQAALPRLLGAAAPPEAMARENRRQCLKVLRLWLERKILPEAVLRHYMDDIGASSDGTSAGFLLRRPSRSERAVDDPIREMEGILVDEYGSNATFQMSGFLSSHVFEEDKEEDLQSGSCKDAGVGSSVEPTLVRGDPDTCSVTPCDKRHCILEDVDGELEMEDVSGYPKDGRSFLTNESFEINKLPGSDSTPINSVPEGSPPLPIDFPPLTPPLPPSPPPPSPPPLPPSSPSPPPPPPPPFSSQPHPPLPSGPPPCLLPQSSLPPQPSVGSQQVHPLKSSVPSSPKLTYQPPVLHEYCPIPTASQPVQVTGSTPHCTHIDAAVRAEMFSHKSSGFLPTGVCNARETSGVNSARPLDYVHNDMYLNPPGSQPNQQFHSGSASFAQRPFHPGPPQIPSSHFSYPNSSIQQHSQHPFPPLYPLPNAPDGQRRYVADDQWRMPSNDVNSDRHGMWMTGGRSSCSGPPFSQEVYFWPPRDGLPANNSGFQLSAPNSLSAGATVQGQGVSQMMPCRPDVSSVNCWRPA